MRQIFFSATIVGILGALPLYAQDKDANTRAAQAAVAAGRVCCDQYTSGNLGKVDVLVGMRWLRHSCGASSCITISVSSRVLVTIDVAFSLNELSPEHAIQIICALFESEGPWG